MPCPDFVTLELTDALGASQLVAQDRFAAMDPAAKHVTETGAGTTSTSRTPSWSSPRSAMSSTRSAPDQTGDDCSISQVAERTGSPPTTLRFSERSGLVRPARIPAGPLLRRHPHRAALVHRSDQGVGAALDEITELLSLRGDDECAPVQGACESSSPRRSLTRRTRVAELEAFPPSCAVSPQRLARTPPDGAV